MSFIDKNILPSQMKQTFGVYIKQLRTNYGLTLTQLAAQLDMDSANLSKIENNKREFDEKRLEKLASVFSLDIDHLKAEFFSDMIAKKIFQLRNSKDILILAEMKLNVLNQS